jgi:hypothetical protein
MSRLVETSERVRGYFRTKAKQLLTLADLPVCEHPGLTGSHREEIQRLYLRDLMPRRFAVGRGMVYGTFHRSREADIVIWDADNYPSLPMADHGFFFADSVRAVLECKSTWSSAEFLDVLSKSKAVRDIVPEPTMTLADEVAILSAQVAAMRTETSYEGTLNFGHHIATAALFLRGGASVDAGLAATCAEIDEEWPDLLLLLEVGRLVIKDYTDKGGVLHFFDLADDALLVFTSALLQLLAQRSVQFESPLNLLLYGMPIDPPVPVANVSFRLSRPRPMRQPIVSGR